MGWGDWGNRPYRRGALGVQPNRDVFSYKGKVDRWVIIGRCVTYFGAMVALGTELTFMVKSHGGDDDNPLTVATAMARLVAAVA